MLLVTPDHTGIGVMRFPDRKHPALVLMEPPNVLRPVAYFKNQEDADLAWQHLQTIARGTFVEDGAP